MDAAFESKRVCYEQHCETIRSLNQTMWQIPIIAMTLAGGLWYAVSSTPSLPNSAIKAMLVFSCFASILLVPIIWRVRHVMQAYIDSSRILFPDASPDTQHRFLKNKTVVVIFSILLFASGCLSLIGTNILSSDVSSPYRCLSDTSLDKNL